MDMKKFIRTLIVTGAGFLPYIASAQSSVVKSVTRQASSFPQTQTTLESFVGTLNGMVNRIVPVLATLAIVFFFYGLVRYIYDAGNSKGHERGRQAMLWGLVSMFIIFSLWGIIQFFQMAIFS